MLISSNKFSLVLLQPNENNLNSISGLKKPLLSKTVSPFIIIDGNWSDAIVKGLCSGGNGSWGNPYIIEDLIIDANGWGFCITIINSSDYFIIENCTLFNSAPSWPGHGITLSLVGNGTIEMNNILDNPKGLAIYSSDNITIINNSITAEYNSIEILYSKNINLFLNNISYNDECIPLLQDCNYIIFNNNTINMSEGGYFLIRSVNNSQFFYNNFTNSYFFLSESLNNTFRYNLFKQGGFKLEGWNKQLCTNHSIDISNKVNDKPIYYYKNQDYVSHNSEAGQIIFANCNSSIISEQDLLNTYMGIIIVYSYNNLIRNSVISNNSYGIAMGLSENNTIQNITFVNNLNSILISYSQENNIYRNFIENSSLGIRIQFSGNNTISYNKLQNGSDYAILLNPSKLKNIFFWGG